MLSSAQKLGYPVVPNGDDMMICINVVPSNFLHPLSDIQTSLCYHDVRDVLALNPEQEACMMIQQLEE